jgi:hypothetical protein
MSEPERIRTLIEKRVQRIGGEVAFRNDAHYYAQIHQLADMLTRVDQAMETEGISRRTRDRVVRTVLYGEPNPIDAKGRIIY